MDEFFKNVSSPGWWFGVVIVGILLNILSSVLYKKLDGFWGKFSEKRRLKNELNKEKELELINSLAADPVRMIAFKQDIIFDLLIPFSLLAGLLLLWIFNMLLRNMPTENQKELEMYTKYMGVFIMFFSSLMSLFFVYSIFDSLNKNAIYNRAKKIVYS